MNDLVGQSLGPYQIIEELGAGGMAKVYKARQTSMNRDVAIKVLPGYMASDPTFSGRFRQEATVIANLEHARILPVYDYGEQDGVAYIVMRYLTGGTLNDLIQEKPLPLDEITRIIEQVSEGLDYAHKHGVIHRDIKPANIIFDDEGDAYIADFGIAKLAEGTAQFTGSSMIGTPAYISPEQGLGIPVVPQSDVYSLGVVLYQVVAGEVPYHAETPLAVVIKHINEPLPPPSTINPTIPPAVEQVIIQALAKDPAQRYASCGRMAHALQAAMLSPDTTTDLPMITEQMDARTTPMSPPQPVLKRFFGRLPKAVWVTLVVLMILTGLLFALRDTPLLSPLFGGQGKRQVMTQSDQAVLFEEHFNDEALSVAWAWIDEPEGWSLDEGTLIVPMLPDTGLTEDSNKDDLDLPALVMNPLNSPTYTIWVDVQVAPEQDFQGAGLILLKEKSHEPLYSLMRAFCAPESDPDCQGDAVYFQWWNQPGHTPSSEQFLVGGAGELPADQPISLMLQVSARLSEINAWYSLDGKNWVKIGRKSLVEAWVGPVGLITSTGGQSTGEALPAQFDNFVITTDG